MLSHAEPTSPSSHPTTFIELLGCDPRDYTSLTIMETWFRWLPIYEISQVRLRLLRRCCQWGLLYWASISGSCWIGGMHRTWVAQEGKSIQHFPFIMELPWENTMGPHGPQQGDDVPPTSPLLGRVYSKIGVQTWLNNNIYKYGRSIYKNNKVIVSLSFIAIMETFVICII